jgi:hypothetical protein
MESFLVVSDQLPAPCVIRREELVEGAAIKRPIAAAMGNPIFRMPEVVKGIV